MQTQTTTTARNANTARNTVQTAPRHSGARDFGTGYGRSSGYAAPRSYSQSITPSRFRFV